MKQILVIAEIFECQIQPVTWELIAVALDIKIKYSQRKIASAINIIVPAEDPMPIITQILKQTGMDVIGLKIPEFTAYTNEVYIYCLKQLIQNLISEDYFTVEQLSHILIAYTSQGRDFASGLAFELNATSISGVNGIRFNKSEFEYSRSVFDNTKNMIVCPTLGQKVVLTLMPGVYKSVCRKEKKNGNVKIYESSFKHDVDCKERIQHQRIIKTTFENHTLKEAKVIVSAGRGIKEKENLEYIVEFAKCFPSSAVGASRPLVDMGWIEYEHQVGITGATVAPRLYIACGISGSSQHLAGMKDAEFIVGINKNPAAPIFRHSDFCIVEDVLEFIEEFCVTMKHL